MNIIFGIIKIIVGMGLMVLSVWWYTEWALKNTQDPYEWEKEMKAIFCDDPESNQKET